jgi:hypothetical protein
MPAFKRAGRPSQRLPRNPYREPQIDRSGQIRNETSLALPPLAKRNLGILAGEFSHVPGGLAQLLAVLAGSATHNVAAYHEVDRGFG